MGGVGGIGVRRGLAGFVQALDCDSFCGSDFFFGDGGLFVAAAGVE